MRAGLLRPLAVPTARRSPLLPEIPAVAETLPGFEVVLWNGLVAPAGTAAAAIARLSAEANAALRGEALRAKLAEQGSVPMPQTPEEFAAFLRAEMMRWAEVIRRAGVRPD